MEETGWPKQYQGDAEIDSLFTLQNPHLVSFVWAVTPTGTHLAYHSDNHRETPAVLWVKAIQENYCNRVRYYLFDNGRVREADFEKAWDFARTLKPVKTVWTAPAVSPYPVIS